MGVATLAQHDLAGSELKTGEGLPARAVGQLDMINGQRPEIEAEVNAPVRARASGLADGGGIDETKARFGVFEVRGSSPFC
jgi:hypothetical protein